MFPDFQIPAGASNDKSPAKDKPDTEKVAKKTAKRENAAGEYALDRALASVNQSKNDQSSSGTSDKSSNLPLSYLEALLLTVMLSSGIPCCEEDDTASDDKKDDIV